MLNAVARLFRSDSGHVTVRGKRRVRRAAPRSRQLLFEPIESRVLLSVSLAGVPDWVDQGPEPILNGGSTVIGATGPVTGAVQSVAVNPNNAQQLYVGTVNGGVWRSNNADPNNPGAVTWTPLTDQQLSLAIGAVEFGRLDNTGNTIYAGTGSFSNLTWSGPPPTAIGILRSTDGGASWTNFAVNSVNEGRIKAIVPTGLDGDTGPAVQEMVLVAEIDAGAGVYRSNDGGQTFVRLSGANGLPGGAVTQLIADPNDPNRFYAALPGQGVYRGDFNAGTGVITWTQVNGAAGSALGSVGTSANIQIAAHDAGAATTLYVGLANGVSGISATLTGVFQSTDAGANWASIGTPGGFNAFAVGGSGFNLIADANPVNNNVVYIGGLGNSQLFRRDTGTTWVQIAGGGNAAGGTTPHADSRDMAFIGTNTLIETDDGGIYYLSTPTNANTTGWRSFIGETTNGNALGGVEFHSIAWDSNSAVIFGGAQDNGTSMQRTTGDVIYTSMFGNDGGDVLVDTFTLDAANQSIRYFSSQNLGIFGNPVDVQGDFRRQVFGANNAPVGGAVEILPAAGLANFNAQFINPIEINAIAPTAAQLTAGQSTRVVVGGGGASPVYESNDAGTAAAPTWTAVNVPVAGPGVTTIGTVTAMAYGGRRNGVDNPDVLYVGDNNGNVFVRTTAGGTLTATAMAFPGGQVTDIALDPNDWQHAFVTDANGIWETNNSGANWVARTGNLNAVQRVGANNSLLQTVEYCELGAVDCILVGGWGGVFRMSTANSGQWSEYGQFLPNAVTYELDYNAADGTLVAGTFGGGAWSIANAGNTLLTTGVLQIFGDDDFSGQNDTIVLAIDPSNPSMLDVLVNNDFFQYQLATIDQINVDSFGGNDKLIVDSTNGLINVVNGIRFNGGDQSDSLELRQNGGPTRSTDAYSVGPNNGQGVSTIVGGGNAGTQTVSFQNLEPVLDLVPVTTLIVNATNGDNAINYVAGIGAGNGLVSIDAHETIEFANKTNLTVNALAGVDSTNINNATTPTGLGTITVNGGDPGSGDTLSIAGAGAAVAVNTATASITGATGAGGAVSLSYNGIEALALTGGVTGLTLTSTGANDALTVTPGAAGAANSGTLTSSGAVPSISFVNSGTVTANLAGGNDTVAVNGTANADTIGVTGTGAAITGRNAVGYSGVESVVVNGLAGEDIFNVTPSSTVAVFIDGGDPIGNLPGDLLNIAAGGQGVTYNAGPETDEGSFVVGANAAVSFDYIESFGISGSGPVTINGTNGPDAITVIARDDSYNAAANGVQDFTVSVNTGPQILFLNVDALTVNSLAGADQITLAAPAPNNAAWNVAVTIDGGPPAAGDADQLVVQTPGAGAETVAYTLASANGGTLNLTSLTSLVTITDIESLAYDGQNDNDSLIVNGTGGDDTIVHTPGSTDQAGRFAVNGLLPINYQNMGATASLKADGLGGSNTLVVQGTLGNDTFSVDAAGSVGLNGRLKVGSTNNATLTLEGLAGDDSFTLVPALSASPFTTLNFNGGGQASATGDRVFLAGGAGDDAFVVSGQTVSLGGKSMVGSGIENIKLDAAGGTNRITYNGVAGVTENITVASSGTAGGGQIIVPNVTLVDFSGVHFITVNGNVPGPTESDTLAFSGTNNVDLFNIKMHAAGSDADPVLKLQTSASATLLTLSGYTNFNTLGINGLDGADTFNVYTADAGSVDRNILIDGGSPTAKKKSTDQLNVYYTGNRPRIIQSAATQNPGSGLVDLQYPSRRFLVQYADIEDVTIPKGVAPW